MPQVLKPFVSPCLLLSVVMVMSSFCSLSLADAKVKEEFDQLFGGEVKRVTATPEPEDDVELAQLLLNAAKGSTDDAAMREHLCEYAYVLGSRDATGYPVSVEAMMFVAENNPTKTAECNAKILAVYQRGYERSSGDKKTEAGQLYVQYLTKQADERIAAKDYGEAMNLLRRARPVAIVIKSDEKDAIQSRIDTYTSLALVANRVDLYEKKIKANPWDKATHSALVELYVTDMDDPIKASKYLELGGDETQKKLIPLAAKSIGDIDEPGALSLADYYESLSKKGVTLTRAAMLTRSKGYYEHYMTLHTDTDVQRTAAMLNMNRVSDALAKLETELGGIKKADLADGKAIELLDYADPSRDGKRGKWWRHGETIKVERGGFTEVPLLKPAVRIEGSSYSLKMKFTRDQGEGAVGIVFPVGNTQVSYAMNLFPQGAAGLSDVNGQGAAANATRKDVSLTNGKVHQVDITVKAEDDGTAAIAIAFDGKSVLEWKGKQSELSINNVFGPGDVKSVAVISFNSAVTFGSVKLKMLSGKVELTEKPVEKSVKAETAKQPLQSDKPRDDDRRDREKMIEDFFKNRGKGKGFGR